MKISSSENSKLNFQTSELEFRNFAISKLGISNSVFSMGYVHFKFGKPYP